MIRLRDKIAHFWFGPTDALRLEVFRRAFALGASWCVDPTRFVPFILMVNSVTDWASNHRLPGYKRSFATRAMLSRLTGIGGFLWEALGGEDQIV